MTLARLIQKRSRGAIATAIPATSAIPAAKTPSPVAGIATIAVANTCKRHPEATSAPPTVAAAWRFHYSNRNPLSVLPAPPITHAEALQEEPGAIAAEPITDLASSTSSEAERVEVLALVRAIHSGDTEQDRQEAIDAALLDPAGALTCYRSIAAARGIEPDAPNSGADAFVRLAAQTGCRSCIHFRQPGHSSGYCASNRDDLPRAYGINHPLRRLPADGGAGCALYQSAHWKQIP